MKHAWPLLFLVSTSCVTVRLRVPHAPAEEASRVRFPSGIPQEGRVRVEGNTAAATLLALNAFLPRESADSCLHQRASYDVSVARQPEGVLLVRLMPNADCIRNSHVSLEATTQSPVVDVTTYAVDIRTWRILAIQRDWRPLASAPTQEAP
jgi:hypothetical protein